MCEHPYKAGVLSLCWFAATIFTGVEQIQPKVTTTQSSETLKRNKNIATSQTLLRFITVQLEKGCINTASLCLEGTWQHRLGLQSCI